MSNQHIPLSPNISISILLQLFAYIRLQDLMCATLKKIDKLKFPQRKLD